MEAGVRALIGETTLILYAYQRGGAGIVGVASIADATRIGRNGQVVEMDQTEEFIYTWLDLLKALKLDPTMD